RWVERKEERSDGGDVGDGERCPREETVTECLDASVSKGLLQDAVLVAVVVLVHARVATGGDEIQLGTVIRIIGARPVETDRADGDHTGQARREGQAPGAGVARC